MDERGLFVASLLDASRKAFAAGSTTRLIEQNDDAAAAVSAWGFGAFVADTEIRLQNLAEALAAGHPELFELDVRWLESTYRARSLPLPLLEAVLDSMRAELAESLPEDARDLAVDYIDRGRSALEGADDLPEASGESTEPHAELTGAFLGAILDGRRLDAEELVLDAQLRGVPIEELHTQVITKAQIEMGRLWQVGDVSVADEHMGSRIVEDVLAILRSRVPSKPESNRRLVAASVAGNLHDIGARMVSDTFELAGWESVFLGADTPGDEVARVVEKRQPDLVALSAGLGIHVRATARCIEGLRSAGGSSIPILVGGQPFTSVEGLWRAVGADACAVDAASALREGERLVSGS